MKLPIITFSTIQFTSQLKNTTKIFIVCLISIILKSLLLSKQNNISESTLSDKNNIIIPILVFFIIIIRNSEYFYTNKRISNIAFVFLLTQSLDSIVYELEVFILILVLLNDNKNDVHKNKDYYFLIFSLISVIELSRNDFYVVFLKLILNIKLIVFVLIFFYSNDILVKEISIEIEGNRMNGIFEHVILPYRSIDINNNPYINDYSLSNSLNAMNLRSRIIALKQSNEYFSFLSRNSYDHSRNILNNIKELKDSFIILNNKQIKSAENSFHNLKETSIPSISYLSDIRKCSCDYSDKYNDKEYYNKQHIYNINQIKNPRLSINTKYLNNISSMSCFNNTKIISKNLKIEKKNHLNNKNITRSSVSLSNYRSSNNAINNNISLSNKNIDNLFLKQISNKEENLTLNKLILDDSSRSKQCLEDKLDKLSPQINNNSNNNISNSNSNSYRYSLNKFVKSDFNNYSEKKNTTSIYMMKTISNSICSNNDKNFSFANNLELLKTLKSSNTLRSNDYTNNLTFATNKTQNYRRFQYYFYNNEIYSNDSFCIYGNNIGNKNTPQIININNSSNSNASENAYMNCSNCNNCNKSQLLLRKNSSISNNNSNTSNIKTLFPTLLKQNTLNSNVINNNTSNIKEVNYQTNSLNLLSKELYDLKILKYSLNNMNSSFFVFNAKTKKILYSNTKLLSLLSLQDVVNSNLKKFYKFKKKITDAEEETLLSNLMSEEKVEINEKYYLDENKIISSENTSKVFYVSIKSFSIEEKEEEFMKFKNISDLSYNFNDSSRVDSNIIFNNESNNSNVNYVNNTNNTKSGGKKYLSPNALTLTTIYSANSNKGNNKLINNSTNNNLKISYLKKEESSNTNNINNNSNNNINSKYNIELSNLKLVIIEEANSTIAMMKMDLEKLRRTKFIITLNHELANPISLLKNKIQVLLDKINSIGLHTNTMINNITSFNINNLNNEVNSIRNNLKQGSTMSNPNNLSNIIHSNTFNNSNTNNNSDNNISSSLQHISKYNINNYNILQHIYSEMKIFKTDSIAINNYSNFIEFFFNILSINIKIKFDENLGFAPSQFKPKKLIVKTIKEFQFLYKQLKLEFSLVDEQEMSKIVIEQDKEALRKIIIAIITFIKDVSPKKTKVLVSLSKIEKNYNEEECDEDYTDKRCKYNTNNLILYNKRNKRDSVYEKSNTYLSGCFGVEENIVANDNRNTRSKNTCRSSNSVINSDIKNNPSLFSRNSKKNSSKTIKTNKTNKTSKTTRSLNKSLNKSVNVTVINNLTQKSQPTNKSNNSLLSSTSNMNKKTQKIKYLLKFESILPSKKNSGFSSSWNQGFADVFSIKGSVATGELIEDFLNGFCSKQDIKFIIFRQDKQLKYITLELLGTDGDHYSGSNRSSDEESSNHSDNNENHFNKNIDMMNNINIKNINNTNSNSNNNCISFNNINSFNYKDDNNDCNEYKCDMMIKIDHASEEMCASSNSIDNNRLNNNINIHTNASNKEDGRNEVSQSPDFNIKKIDSKNRAYLNISNISTININATNNSRRNSHNNSLLVANNTYIIPKPITNRSEYQNSDIEAINIEGKDNNKNIYTSNIISNENENTNLNDYSFKNSNNSNTLIKITDDYISFRKKNSIINNQEMTDKAGENNIDTSSKILVLNSCYEVNNDVLLEKEIDVNVSNANNVSNKQTLGSIYYSPNSLSSKHSEIKDHENNMSKKLDSKLLQIPKSFKHDKSFSTESMKAINLSKSKIISKNEINNNSYNNSQDKSHLSSFYTQSNININNSNNSFNNSINNNNNNNIIPINKIKKIYKHDSNNSIANTIKKLNKNISDSTTCKHRKSLKNSQFKNITQVETENSNKNSNKSHVSNKSDIINNKDYIKYKASNNLTSKKTNSLSEENLETSNLFFIVDKKKSNSNDNSICNSNNNRVSIVSHDNSDKNRVRVNSEQEYKDSIKNKLLSDLTTPVFNYNLLSVENSSNYEETNIADSLNYFNNYAKRNVNKNSNQKNIEIKDNYIIEDDKEINNKCIKNVEEAEVQTRLYKYNYYYDYSYNSNYLPNNNSNLNSNHTNSYGYGSYDEMTARYDYSKDEGVQPNSYSNMSWKNKTSGSSISKNSVTKTYKNILIKRKSSSDTVVNNNMIISCRNKNKNHNQASNYIYYIDKDYMNNYYSENQSFKSTNICFNKIFNEKKKYLLQDFNKYYYSDYSVSNNNGLKIISKLLIKSEFNKLKRNKLKSSNFYFNSNNILSNYTNNSNISNNANNTHSSINNNDTNVNFLDNNNFNRNLNLLRNLTLSNSNNIKTNLIFDDSNNEAKAYNNRKVSFIVKNSVERDKINNEAIVGKKFSFNKILGNEISIEKEDRNIYNNDINTNTVSTLNLFEKKPTKYNISELLQKQNKSKEHTTINDMHYKNNKKTQDKANKFKTSYTLFNLNTANKLNYSSSSSNMVYSDSDIDEISNDKIKNNSKLKGLTNKDLIFIKKQTTKLFMNKKVKDKSNKTLFNFSKIQRITSRSNFSNNSIFGRNNQKNSISHDCSINNSNSNSNNSLLTCKINILANQKKRLSEFDNDFKIKDKGVNINSSRKILENSKESITSYNNNNNSNNVNNTINTNTNNNSNYTNNYQESNDNELKINNYFRNLSKKMSEININTNTNNLLTNNLSVLNILSTNTNNLNNISDNINNNFKNINKKNDLNHTIINEANKESYKNFDFSRSLINIKTSYLENHIEENDDLKKNQRKLLYIFNNNHNSSNSNANANSINNSISNNFKENNNSNKKFKTIFSNNNQNNSNNTNDNANVHDYLTPISSKLNKNNHDEDAFILNKSSKGTIILNNRNNIKDYKDNNENLTGLSSKRQQQVTKNRKSFIEHSSHSSFNSMKEIKEEENRKITVLNAFTHNQCSRICNTFLNDNFKLNNNNNNSNFIRNNSKHNTSLQFRPEENEIDYLDNYSNLKNISSIMNSKNNSNSSFKLLNRNSNKPNNNKQIKKPHSHFSPTLHCKYKKSFYYNDHLEEQNIADNKNFNAAKGISDKLQIELNIKNNSNNTNNTLKKNQSFNNKSFVKKKTNAIKQLCTRQSILINNNTITNSFRSQISINNPSYLNPSTPVCGIPEKVYLFDDPEIICLNSPKKFDSSNTHQNKTFHKCSQAKVLVVDDEKTIRKTLINLLKSRGIEADEACGGRECVDKVYGKYNCITCPSYKLIFMDIWMPEMDGIEASQLLNSSFSNNFIKIIIVSAHDQESVRDMCKMIPIISTFVKKPVNKKIMKELITKYLD